MTKLRVIKGIQKVKPDYYLLYTNVFLNECNKAMGLFPEFKDYDLDTRRKMIWAGVKMINAYDYENRGHESLTNAFGIISSIKDLMGTLTPREFQTIYPIAKDYDGEKYEMKDYFYTKKYIEEFGMDRVIGEEALRIHMDYHNREVTRFAVQTMCIMSAIRRAEGGKGIAEEFFEDKGITTYTMAEDHKGKKYLINNETGEITKVNKPRPRYLKVIK